MGDDSPSTLHVSSEEYRLSSELVSAEAIVPFCGFFRSSVVFGMLNVLTISLSWYVCGEELDGERNSMLFSPTAMVLHTPDSDESVVTSARAIGARAKNVCGVSLIQESSSSDAEIVPPIRESVSPVR